MRIPFTKAHGARNDFLLTWAHEAPAADARAMARAICDRRAGIGGDGWILVSPATTAAHGAIRLLNSDGSDSEISGNGTRCAAAFLLDAGLDAGDIRIATGAGTKQLRLLGRQGRRFEFEMNMGRPLLEQGGLRFPLPLPEELPEELPDEPLEVTILNMGNPQCAVFVDDFDFDWRDLGGRIEDHPQFPRRTNVSFVRVLSPHAIEVRFWERGAGETMSSGTGSSGAAAAGILRGLCRSPLEVNTPGGILQVRWDGDDLHLTGPAEIIAGGEFYFE
ncbi:MAG: diaminopimelate epimerase [Acidobacteria bacterium]|nr:diaminopimelate epimerase [Acidobacteriota bacterium]